MQNWNDFQTILALHQAGTIRGAANLLKVNHATVSRKLYHLEREIGESIFEKTPQGYKANSKGLLLIESAKQIQQTVDAASRKSKAIESEISGNISLSLPNAIAEYLLFSDLINFAKQHPQLNVIINSSNSLVDLDKNEADVVIRGSQNPPPHLVGHRLFPYCLALYANKHYFESTKRADLRWICPPSTQHKPAWITETAYADIPVGMQMSDISLRHSALLAGKGIVRSACYMADPEPSLIRLPDSRPIPVADLWVLTHPDMRHSPKIQLFMRFLCDALREKEKLIRGELLYDYIKV